MNKQISSVRKRIYLPRPASVGEYISDLIVNRHLVRVLAWQEIRGQYAQTYLGLFWAVLRPVLLTVIFTLFFKGLLNVKTQSPYYLFAFTGMVAWNFFSSIANQASGVMIQRRDLIRKLQFPKLLLPIYKILVAGVEAGVGLAILLVMILLSGQHFHIGIITLPFFIFFNICSAFVLAIWVNALSIKFRDLTHLLPTLIGAGIWLTPVFYPTTLLPEKFNFLLYLNPMAAVIQGFRYALLGEPFPAWQFFISLAAVLILSIAGIWYLIQVEDEIADYA